MPQLCSRALAKNAHRKGHGKEKKNIRAHGLDFSFAEHVFHNPLAITVYDRWENGEDRWHTFAPVGSTVLLVVHTYPDSDDEGQSVRVIGLREATARERRRYEEGEFD